MQAKILMVEGKRAGSISFTPGLRRKGYHVESVPTGKSAVARLNAFTPDLIIVDASTMRSTGVRICFALMEAAKDKPIILIANPEYPIDKEIGVNFILEHPFTIRKLVNRVKVLLPLQSSQLLTAGPIYLDLDKKRVQCQTRDEPLTPRLTQLLEMFMRQPGVVLERESIFKHVWNTEYTADTRTLDVHISWLRQAIEENPRTPRYLKTIRGIGYRLDIDS